MTAAQRRADSRPVDAERIVSAGAVFDFFLSIGCNGVDHFDWPLSRLISCSSVGSPAVGYCGRQWGAADAEIKVPSGENTELKRSPFKAWSRSVYSHACYADCHGFLPNLFLPFRFIHLHFFKTSPNFFLCWLWLTHGSCVGPQNRIGHLAGCRFPC